MTKPAQADWSDDHLRLAVQAACVALWSWNVDDHLFRDGRAWLRALGAALGG